MSPGSRQGERVSRSDALYNEIEPFACDWLDGLIARQLIARGRVDRRSITELRATDVAGPGQRHFFAGIGGWSHALRLAGVADDADIWTGSCPCQPFSNAGRRAGTEDARHLWPDWFRLIRECHPSIIFGEQVTSPDGRRWLDAVLADLEGAGYSVGAADLCAAGIGAPHRRQRIYFVAYARQGGRAILGPSRIHDRGQRGHDVAGRGEVGELADNERDGREDRISAGPATPTARRSDVRASELGDASSNGDREHAGELRRDEGEHADGRAHGDHASLDAGAARGTFWSRAEWIECRDGRTRPIEPGTFPLADGLPGRVGRLRAYGNAIVPQLAATFIRAAFGAMT